MFRSLASSLLTFVAVLLFAFTIIFLWSGSQGIQFKRVAMEGDRSTAQIIAEYAKKLAASTDVADNSSTDTDMTESQPAMSSGDGPPVVVWISIPGFRGDYLEKSDTPFFDQLASEGDSTNKMRPSFPCLTFPAHATMATGVATSVHGIVADRIKTADGVIEPMDSALLEAEPIWTTATRQGIKTIVHDWPLSQNQTGENSAASFLESYDPDLSDEDRLNKALEAWRLDSSGGAAAEPAAEGETGATEGEAMAAEGETGATEGEAMAAEGEAEAEPAPAAGGSDERVRLVMLRLNDISRAGLTNGPREDATYEAVAATDTALKAFFDTIQAEWSTLAPPSANLIFFVTTDHGLAELDKNVNIAHLLGDEMMANAEIIAHDAVANLFFKDLPESDGEKKIFIDKFDAELGKRIYFRTIKKDDIPETWSYLSPERTGDRILVLKTGYAFAEEKADEPVFDPSDGPGLYGGFGYPVEESIRMSGQVLLAGFPNSPTKGGMDEISQLTFHATVCKLLDIEPAEGASTETLPVE